MKNIRFAAIKDIRFAAIMMWPRIDR